MVGMFAEDSSSVDEWSPPSFDLKRRPITADAPSPHHTHSSITSAEDEANLGTRTARALSIDDSDTARIVVSGSVFLTSITTLTSRDPDSLFCERLLPSPTNLLHFVTPEINRRSLASPLSTPRRGPTELVFDRDPKHFLSVLNYLRTGKLWDPKASTATLTALQKEADFYRCVGLSKQIELTLQARSTESKQRMLASSARQQTDDGDLLWGIMDGLIRPEPQHSKPKPSVVDDDDDDVFPMII